MRHLFSILVTFLTAVAPFMFTVAHADTPSTPAFLGESMEPPPLTPPQVFYGSLTNAIAHAEGIGKIRFNAGKYRTKYGNAYLLWTFEPNTKADFRFLYHSKVLNNASVTFTPAIRVESPAPHCFVGFLRGIEFDNDGDAQVLIEPCADCCKDDLGKRDIERHLTMSIEPRDMFRARPLSAWASAERLDSNGNPTSTDPTPLIDYVFFHNRDDIEGLAVTLSSNVELVLSKADALGNVDNRIELGENSSVRIAQLKYTVDERELHCVLDSMALNIAGGELTSGDFKLFLAPGGTLHFANAAFDRHPDGLSTVDARNGVLSATIGRGSIMSLGQLTQHSQTDTTRDGVVHHVDEVSTKTSSVVIGDGSGVIWKDFGLKIGADHVTTVSMGATSAATLKILSGSLDLGGKGYAQLSPSEINFKDVSGTWTTGAPPSFHGTIARLDVNVLTGLIQLTPETNLSIEKAVLVGNGLSVSSDTSPVITGPIEQLLIPIAEGSLIRLSDTVSIRAAAGGRLAALASLKLVAGHSYPVGQYTLFIPFTELSVGTTAGFGLHNGNVEFPLENHMDGSVTSPTIVENGVDRVDPHKVASVKGASLSASVGDNSRIRAALDMTNGQLLPPDAGDVRFSGSLGGSISEVSINESTPYLGKGGTWDTDNDGHANEDARLFPVRVVFSLRHPQPIGPMNFRYMRSGEVQVDEASVVLECNGVVPVGCGDYKDKDNPSKGCDGGYCGNCQELFRDNFVGATEHIYLKPASYVFKVTLKIGVVGSALNIDIGGLETDRAIEWTEGGLEVIKALGVIVGGLLGGVPGVVIVAVGETEAQKRMTQLLDERIAQKLQDVHKSWTLGR